MKCRKKLTCVATLMDGSWSLIDRMLAFCLFWGVSLDQLPFGLGLLVLGSIQIMSDCP